MAWAQTIDDKTAPAVVSRIDTNGYWYFELGGGLRFYVGNGGSPTGLLTDAPMGSIAVDKDSGQWYCADDASGTFTAISTAMS